MSEKERFVVGSNEIGEIIVTDVETGKVYRRDNLSNFFGLIRLLNEQDRKIRQLNSDYNYLKEVNKETVKQCERWKNLYELKDSEVSARVDALNKVCEYYTSEVLFKSDVDPNKAVREVINRILNTEVEMW